METRLEMPGRKVVGFAILVEEDGERMLIYSDSVYAGSVTLIQEQGPIMQSDDSVMFNSIRSQSFEVNLLGDNITLRKEYRPMGELLLEDSQYDRAIKQLTERGT